MIVIMRKNVLELPLKKQFKLARKTKNQNYIAVFSLSDEVPVLAQLALNPNTPGTVLHALALNSSAHVKACVLANGSNVRKETVLQLRNDEDMLVRNIASLVHWNEN